MTTHAPTATNFASSTNAEFRAWVQEFEAALLATGLVNTADTGQIDPATVNVPATSTKAGYRIWRTNDGLTNLFLRIEYGLGTQTTRPQASIRVGYGTNGAGTLTGTALTAVTEMFNSSPIASTSTPYPNRACGVTGCWWVAFKEGSVGLSQGHGGFALFRHCDADGTPNNNGFSLYYSTTNGSASCVNVIQATSTINTDSNAPCLIPFGFSNPVVGAGLQYWKHFSLQPRMRVNPFAYTTRIGDVPSGTTRTLSPLTGISKTYISVGYPLGSSAGKGAAADNTMMLVWQ